MSDVKFNLSFKNTYELRCEKGDFGKDIKNCDVDSVKTEKTEEKPPVQNTVYTEETKPSEALKATVKGQ
jgi:hypothetical protein